MQLIVGLAGEQLACVARLQHLAQPFRPIAAGKEAAASAELRGGRRDVGVVVVEADAEVGVVERPGRAASARSSASLIRLPSTAAARRSPRRTRHCTRGA